MRSSEAKVKFNSLLTSLAYSKGIRDVFVDLIDATLQGMIIHDECNLKRNPYTDYSEEDREKLIELMILLGDIMENDGEGLHDALGDLFMEYLSFGKNGQFFTPQEITDMMAIMTFSGTEVKPGQSVNDCACGSGRMFLSAAKINKDLRFYGSDIDLVCVKMAVLNLALNNLVGEIVWGNPLTMEHYASFQINKDFLTKFPFITIVKEERSIHFKTSVKQILDHKRIDKKEISKPVQLKLFEDV